MPDAHGRVVSRFMICHVTLFQMFRQDVGVEGDHASTLSNLRGSRGVAPPVHETELKEGVEAEQETESPGAKLSEAAATATESTSLCCRPSRHRSQISGL